MKYQICMCFEKFSPQILLLWLLALLFNNKTSPYIRKEVKIQTLLALSASAGTRW